MSRKYPRSALACPACNTKNNRALAAIRLMNPVGCDETVELVACQGCNRGYIEVEEDGEEHERNGPDYWVRGPVPPRTFASLLKLVRTCQDRYFRHCDCAAHSAVDKYMYENCKAVQPPEKVRPLPAWILRERPTPEKPAIPITPAQEREISELIRKAAPNARVTVFRKRSTRRTRNS